MFPHISPCFHSWLFKTLWVMIFWVWVIQKRLTLWIAPTIDSIILSIICNILRNSMTHQIWVCLAVLDPPASHQQFNIFNILIFFMTHPILPLHDPPDPHPFAWPTPPLCTTHPTPVWSTPPLYDPPHPCMTHPTPAWPTPPLMGAPFGRHAALRLFHWTSWPPSRNCTPQNIFYYLQMYHML